MRELIRFAYGVKDFQIQSAPKCVDSARFDIVAKTAGGQASGLDDEKSLVREFLGDRFQLRVHRGSKQMPVYLLVVAKDGPKLAAHNDAGPKTRGGCGRLVGRGVTADSIASMLARQLDREVVNRTGLPGQYDMQLDFTPNSGPCRPANDTANGPATMDPTGLPSIYAALQQQLGLKLESGKGAVGLLVIDRVARPAEN